jgi:hypothetical protein
LFVAFKSSTTASGSNNSDIFIADHHPFRVSVPFPPFRCRQPRGSAEKTPGADCISRVQPSLFFQLPGWTRRPRLRLATKP